MPTCLTGRMRFITFCTVTLMKWLRSEDCIRSLMLWKTFALMPSDIKNIRAAIFGAMNTFLRWLGQGSFRKSTNILRRARFFALLAIGA